MNARSLKLIELLEPRKFAAPKLNRKRQMVTRVIRQPEMIEFDRLDRRARELQRSRGGSPGGAPK